VRRRACHEHCSRISPPSRGWGAQRAKPRRLPSHRPRRPVPAAARSRDFGAFLASTPIVRVPKRNARPPASSVSPVGHGLLLPSGPAQQLETSVAAKPLQPGPASGDSKGCGRASQVTQEQDPVTEGWGWGVLAHCPMVGANVEANHAGGRTLFQRLPPAGGAEVFLLRPSLLAGCEPSALRAALCALISRRFASYLPTVQTSFRSPPFIAVDDSCAPPIHPSTVPNPSSTGLVPSCVGTPSSRCLACNSLAVRLRGISGTEDRRYI